MPADLADFVLSLGSRISPTPYLLALLVALTLCLTVAPLRRAIVGAVRSHGRRIRWRRAVTAVAPSHFGARAPTLWRPRGVAVGWRGEVWVPKGSTVADLEAKREALAGVLGVREVRVRRNPANARRAWVTVVDRDPLVDAGTLPWPNADAERLSLWRAIPVGVDEDGASVTMRLPEQNVLVGGIPGSGKSCAVSMLVATAALDPSVKLWLLDGKGGVELAVWRGCAERAVDVDVDDAIDVLSAVQAEMARRYARLLEARKRKIEPGDGLPLMMLVVDEMAHYLTAGTKPQSAEFGNLMRDIVSRGRAAGVIAVVATQKPSVDIVPSSMRDLFGFRWGLRCSTPQASDTILGQGWASMGYNAAEIDSATRGVGYLLHEGGRPDRVKAYYLGDDDLAAIADRAEALRGGRTVATVPLIGG